MNFTRILSSLSKQLTANPIVRTYCAKRTASAPPSLFKKPTKIYEKALQGCRNAGDLMKSLTASLEKQFSSKALDYSQQWSRYLYSSTGKREDVLEQDVNVKPKKLRSYECRRKLAGGRKSGSGGNDSNRCGKPKAKCKPVCPRSKPTNPCPVVEDECAKCPPKPKCVKKCQPESAPPRRKKTCPDPAEVCPKPRPRCPQPDKTAQPKCPKPGQKQKPVCPPRPKDCARKCPPVEKKQCGSAAGGKSASQKSTCDDEKPKCPSVKVSCPKPRPKCPKKPEKSKKCSLKKQETSCKKPNPCAKKSDSCGKKEDPCGKKKQQKCQPRPSEDACSKSDCGGCGKSSSSGGSKCKKFEKLGEECDPQGGKGETLGSVCESFQSESDPCRSKSESCREEGEDKCKEKPKEIPDIFKQLKNILNTSNKAQLEGQFGEYYKNTEYFMYKTHSFYDVMRHLQNKRLPVPSSLPPKKPESICDAVELESVKKSKSSLSELPKKQSKCGVSKAGRSPCKSSRAPARKKEAKKTTWCTRKKKTMSPKKKPKCGCGKCGTSKRTSGKCGSSKGGSGKCGSRKGGSGKCGSS